MIIKMHDIEPGKIELLRTVYPDAKEDIDERGHHSVILRDATIVSVANQLFIGGIGFNDDEFYNITIF